MNPTGAIAKGLRSAIQSLQGHYDGRNSPDERRSIRTRLSSKWSVQSQWRAGRVNQSRNATNARLRANLIVTL